MSSWNSPDGLRRGELANADNAASLIQELVQINPMDEETAKHTFDAKASRRKSPGSIHLTTVIIQDTIFATGEGLAVCFRCGYHLELLALLRPRLLAP
jgi:hypothetical protein